MCKISHDMVGRVEVVKGARKYRMVMMLDTIGISYFSGTE